MYFLFIVENHGQVGLEDLQVIRKQLQNLNQTLQASKISKAELTKSIDDISKQVR